MEKYIGCKIIEAEPMYRKEAIEKGYNRLNDKEKESEIENTYGYHINYTDGYESWSPAEIFEDAYRPIDNLNITAKDMMSRDYKERFKAEYIQIKERYNRLRNMCNIWDNEGVKGLGFTPTCPRDICNDQISAMKEYMNILETRAKWENIELN